ncbi:response regulator transcription factor [Micrococcales bacterium 31B]|nr:response regulator transcription factor [Micrococcales bacterium 31B]
MSDPAEILVVDDDDFLLDFVATSLKFAGYAVRTARDGQAALDAIAEKRPDAVILDVMMPRLDGLGALKHIRHNETGHLPVLMLTAREDVDSRVEGLSLGADDYLPKPFSLDELVARLTAVLRRFQEPEPVRRMALGDLEILESSREVWRRGVHIDLSPTEYDVLIELVHNAGKVMSKYDLLMKVWRHDFGGESTVLESYMSYLRRKLHADGPPLIHTVRGFGYVLRPVEASA